MGRLSIADDTPAGRLVKKRRIVSDEPESKKMGTVVASAKSTIGSLLVGTKGSEPAIGVAAEGSTDGETPSLVSDRKTPGIGRSDTSSLSSLSDSEEGF